MKKKIDSKKSIKKKVAPKKSPKKVAPKKSPKLKKFRFTNGRDEKETLTNLRISEETF